MHFIAIFFMITYLFPKNEIQNFLIPLLIPLLKSKIQRFQNKISTRVIGVRGVFFYQNQNNLLIPLLIPLLKSKLLKFHQQLFPSLEGLGVCFVSLNFIKKYISKLLKFHQQLFPSSNRRFNDSKININQSYRG